MSRIFSALIALTLLAGLIAGCGTDPGITAPQDDETAITPTVGIYKVTHHGEEVAHAFFLQSDVMVEEAMAVLVEIGDKRNFVIIHEGETMSRQYPLEEKVAILDAFERVKELTPVNALGGELIEAGYNFLAVPYEVGIANTAVAP